VQLIEAESGVNVWTNSYDRELTDVLAIQEDIATAISAALRVPLGLQPNQHLTSGHIPDAALYDNYLRAKALMRARGFDRLSEAARLLEPVVAREPEFAPALAMLGQVYVLQVAADPATRNDSEEARGLREAYFDKAERAAREAIRLDSQNAFAYTALARVQERRGRWAEADDLHKQALVLDPGEPDAQNNYIFFLANTGQLKEAVNRAERLRDVEPFVPIYATRMATIMQQSGQVDASIPILEALPPDTGGGGFNRNTFLAQAYAEQGRYGDAADTLLLIDPSLAPRVEDSARLLRSAPTPARAPESLPVLGPGFAFVYAHVGAHDRVVGAYERALAGGFNPGTLDAWLPAMAPMRKTERFKAYVRKAGLVDYWRERGWPDLCRPVGADDFVCE
jgi:tetratricopeptide (TPR) repeat protein